MFAWLLCEELATEERIPMLFMFFFSGEIYMMFRRHFIAAAIAATMIATMPGCAALNDAFGYKQGTLITDEQLATLKVGVTTRQQIIDAFGGPQDIKTVGGKEHLVYRYTLISAIGPNDGRTVTLVLSKNKLVEKLVSKNNPQGNPMLGQ